MVMNAQYGFLVAAFMMLGLAILCASLGLLGSGALPTWLCWTGVVVAALAQADRTWPSTTRTANAVSPVRAGPRLRSPLSSNCEPWHGQLSRPSSGATVQPSRGQTALAPCNLAGTPEALISLVLTYA